VFAAMRDKDADGMLRALLPAVIRVVFTHASNTRSADPRALAELARKIRPEIESTIAPSPASALVDAWRSSPRIVVAGSIFLLGDVCKEIGG